MMRSSLFTVVVIFISLSAAVVDVRTRRIPNLLTFGAAIFAFMFHALSSGVPGALGAAAGCAVGMLLFLPFFALGGMGGGDVKLLAALGAWLGPRDTLSLALYSALAGGVLGIVVLLAEGYLRTALRNLRGMFAYWHSVGLGPVPNLTLESAKGPRLAYAIPIFAGTVITLWR